MTACDMRRTVCLTTDRRQKNGTGSCRRGRCLSLFGSRNQANDHRLGTVERSCLPDLTPALSPYRSRLNDIEYSSPSQRRASSPLWSRRCMAASEHTLRDEARRFVQTTLAPQVYFAHSNVPAASLLLLLCHTTSKSEQHA